MIAIAIRTTSVSVKLAETETMWNYCETVVEWSMLQEIDEAAAVQCSDWNFGTQPSFTASLQWNFETATKEQLGLRGFEILWNSCHWNFQTVGLWDKRAALLRKNEGMRKLFAVGEGDSIVMCVQKIQQKRKKSEEKFQEKDRVCRFHPSLYFFPIQCLPSWHPGIHASAPNSQLHVNIGPTPKKISHSIYINSNWP